MERNLTCIECPRGCSLTVKITDNGVTVDGNFCPKGKIYGQNEVVCPKRTVTSTVRAGKVLVPIKTDKQVQKNKIFEVVEKIHAYRLLTKVKIGDIIIYDVDGEGANVIACAPFDKGEK